MNHFSIIRKSPLFAGMTETEISSILVCLSASERNFKKGEYVFREGEILSSLGLVLNGSVHILKDDFWGVRTIIGEASGGELFGEAYACTFREPLEVDVTAVEDCTILFLDVARILTVCGTVCEFHTRMIRNLLSVLAQKNLMLTRKIDHMAKRTTREKLLSYLSAESKKAEGLVFEIPFNRQQLADYLCVDRSAMSGELGKLRDEGLIDFEKSKFRFLKANQLID